MYQKKRSTTLELVDPSARPFNTDVTEKLLCYKLVTGFIQIHTEFTRKASLQLMEILNCRLIPCKFLNSKFSAINKQKLCMNSRFETLACVRHQLSLSTLFQINPFAFCDHCPYKYLQILVNMYLEWKYESLHYLWCITRVKMESWKILVWLSSSSNSLCMQRNSTARINQEYLVKISFIAYKGSFASAASTDDFSKK